MTHYHDMRARHRDEHRAMVLDAMIRSNWSLTRAARYLGVAVSTMQSALSAHRDLADDYSMRKPPRGRPRKPTASGR